MEKEKQIYDINNWAVQYPHRVFDNDFLLQRRYLTEETWKAVIQENPDMLDSASPKWRKIPNANIVNKYQGQAFSGEVRKAINEDGVKLAGLTAAVPGAIIGGGVLAKPVLSLLFYHPGTFFAETIVGAIGGYAGGAATDAITRGVSDYDSFANMIASNSAIPELYAEMLNPGMLLGGLAGGVGGNVLYNNIVKPTAQRTALPYLIARLLNKNIDNTVLPLEKTIRLYRGTGTNGQISLDGGVEQAGQWFTPLKTKTGSYLSNLLAYAKRKGINNPTFLEYVDIPESLLEYYRAKRILDPKKVEFEPNEDYLIPLHIKRNKIEIPHFTNSQERLDLHAGQSLPETSFSPSNTLWDTSKHIYYDIKPTATLAAKTSLKFYERPSTLTEAERLGISKGDRNNNKKYGNIKFIRNIGLHDKPNYMPYMSDGKIKLSSDENLLVNLTTDLPFRTHLKYAYRPGGEIMIIDPKAFRGQTFLSLDPSDSIVLNKDLVVDPKHVQIITGNKDIAKTLSKSGITTHTSPKLQIEYKKAMQANPQIQIGKIRLDKKKFGDTPNEYTKTVDDFITKYIGRPELGDYQKLQQTTNVNPHVTKFNDLINLLLLLLKLNTTKLKEASDLEDINLFTFPDKTSFTYYDIAVPSTLKKTINTPYKNVFYNPFSSIENDLMHYLGIGQHPKYSDEFQNILKQYILKNNIKPLKKQGGIINYLNLFKNNFQK